MSTPRKHKNDDDEPSDFESPTKKKNDELVTKIEETTITDPAVQESSGEDTIQTSKELKEHSESGYEKFSAFGNLNVGSGNIGTFGVVACHFKALGDDLRLTEPVTNLILIDIEKQMAHFSCFGLNAENWGKLIPGQVVHIENFLWQQDIKNSNQFYGISLGFNGSFKDFSSFEILPEISEVFTAHRAKEIDHIYTLLEIHNPFDRIVLTLEKKGSKEKTVRKLDKKEFMMCCCLFTTSDGGVVEITAFEKNCDIFNTLDIHKTYAIQLLKKAPPRANKEIFHVTMHTTFMPVVIKAPEAIKATLMDLTKANVNDPVMYESEVYIRQGAVKCPMYNQGMVFQYGKQDDVQLAAIIRFTDNLDLRRGQRIRLKYHLGEEFTKKVMRVIAGSVVVIPGDSFPVDQIDQLKFNVI